MTMNTNRRPRSTTATLPMPAGWRIVASPSKLYTPPLRGPSSADMAASFAVTDRLPIFGGDEARS